MKQIKLEVGKTYRNRKGEEIKIVWSDNTGRYPYQGSDDEWYKESGQWCITEDPHDLIEEVAKPTRHTFTIPDGVTKLTVEQVSNRIIVEMVPEKEPKPGDVCRNYIGSVYIFKEAANTHTHRHYAWFGRDGRLAIGSMCTPGRPATPEEAQPLFDALKKAGKRWNSETLQVEDVPESDRIREWAEKHYSNHQGIAEAIEAYLKYRGGK